MKKSEIEKMTVAQFSNELLQGNIYCWAYLNEKIKWEKIRVKNPEFENLADFYRYYSVH